MAKKDQTTLGKAFEFACLLALQERVNRESHAKILYNQAVSTAKDKFNSLNQDDHINFLRAAKTAVRFLLKLEPKLLSGKEDAPIYLTLQTDSAGIKGDVRDVICKNYDNSWQIGLSCKHNHAAVKHSRLSQTINFGEKWFGYTCSSNYFDEITPIFEELASIRNNSNGMALWKDIVDKENKYYIPVLNAFVKELKSLTLKYDDIPEKLIRYLIGEYDFYKIITDDNRETTRLEAINLNGNLNVDDNGIMAIVSVPILSLPRHFYHIDFCENSKNKIEIICDSGWSVTMRIHNASARVEPSLKFDVQLNSVPHSIFSQIDTWDH